MAKYFLIMGNQLLKQILPISGISLTQIVLPHEYNTLLFQYSTRACLNHVTLLILPHFLTNGLIKPAFFELGMLLSGNRYDYELVKKQHCAT